MCVAWQLAILLKLHTFEEQGSAVDFENYTNFRISDDDDLTADSVITQRKEPPDLWSLLSSFYYEWGKSLSDVMYKLM